jgi:diguanylate cyclase (GGDEF)-like protein
VYDGKQTSDVRSSGTLAVLQEGLDLLQIGLAIYDSDLHLVAFNRAYLTLNDFPPELGKAGTPLEAFFRHNAAHGEYGDKDLEAQVQQRLALARKFEPQKFTRSRPDGSVLEICRHPLPSGGFISTFTDITEITRAKEALEEKEQEMARHLEDIDLERAMVEKQAQKMVHMAEDLAVQNKEIEKSRQESEFQARHDELTALPNRRYFNDQLEQALAVAGSAGAHKALLFIDLDNFKPINDKLGHDRGDSLLRTVALRLTSTVRDGDFVTRLGGDEFAVLAAMKAGNGLDGVRTLAERILAALTIKVEEAEPPIQVTASIGVACFPSDATQRAGLLHAADQAMYEAKSRGRNRIVFAAELAASDAAE